MACSSRDPPFATALFQTMCGSRGSGTAALADMLCGALQAAAGPDRIPVPVLKRVRACIGRPSVAEAVRCMSDLQACLHDTLWAGSGVGGTAGTEIWSDRRRRLTNDWKWTPPVTALDALGPHARVHRALTVHLSPPETGALRLVCKAMATAWRPSAVLEHHGIAAACQGLFLQRDETRTAVWVRLALRLGEWVQPFPGSPPASAAAAAAAGSEYWAVVQHAVVRWFLHVRHGVVHRVYSVHRCAPVPHPPAPRHGARVVILAPTPSTSVPGTMRQRLAVEGLDPLLVITWGAASGIVP